MSSGTRCAHSKISRFMWLARERKKEKEKKEVAHIFQAMIWDLIKQKIYYI